MNNIPSDFWDERYSINDFVYGLEPNIFFSQELKKLKPGKLYLPADGEGRNSIFAAKLGWEVDAVDFSTEAKSKALKFAEQENVKINYTVSDLNLYTPPSSYYDAAGVIFLHLNRKSTEEIAKKIISSLKPGGLLIMQVYSKNQLGKSSGGPQNLEMLSSIEEIKEYYGNLNIIRLSEENISLYESKFHNGEASVINMIGQKT